VASFVSLEMTISREEFLRLLPVALGQAFVPEPEGRFSGGAGARRWTLHLRPLAPRRLGSVVLPCHQVEFCFEGYSESEVTEFMARFHRGFHRGGG
jgi:hypothetical protein